MDRDNVNWIAIFVTGVSLFVLLFFGLMLFPEVRR